MNTSTEQFQWAVDDLEHRDSYATLWVIIEDQPTMIQAAGAAMRLGEMIRAQLGSAAYRHFVYRLRLRAGEF